MEKAPLAREAHPGTEPEPQGTPPESGRQSAISTPAAHDSVLLECCAAVDQPEDVTGRAHCMPKMAALLYPRSKKLPGDAPYGGVMVSERGRRYWISQWRRTVHGKEVYELKIALMKEGQP